MRRPRLAQPPHDLVVDLVEIDDFEVIHPDRRRMAGMAVLLGDAE
jgi:hypothetical protein